MAFDVIPLAAPLSTSTLRPFPRECFGLVVQIWEYENNAFEGQHWIFHPRTMRYTEDAPTTTHDRGIAG